MRWLWKPQASKVADANSRPVAVRALRHPHGHEHEPRQFPISTTLTGQQQNLLRNWIWPHVDKGDVYGSTIGYAHVEQPQTYTICPVFRTWPYAIYSSRLKHFSIAQVGLSISYHECGRVWGALTRGRTELPVCLDRVSFELLVRPITSYLIVYSYYRGTVWHMRDVNRLTETWLGCPHPYMIALAPDCSFVLLIDPRASFSGNYFLIGQKSLLDHPFEWGILKG